MVDGVVGPTRVGVLLWCGFELRVGVIVLKRCEAVRKPKVNTSGKIGCYYVDDRVGY